ncbi:MAG: hypothetical protein JSS49_09500 [Planctomycetes bacterium]|nr:hypothetical protein [Planctomycetota bacterium]
MKTLGGRLLTLTAGMLAAGVLLGVVAFGVSGYPGVEGLVYSIVLCLIPGLLTVYSGEFLKHRGLAAYIVLAGGGFRMLFVLLGMFAVSALRPDLGFRQFTVWLIISYLVALALETAVILAPAASGDSVQDQG